MKFGMEQMNHVIEKMAAGQLPYQSNVVIGDNSSGKSLLMKKFIEKVGEDVYFIDAVNRVFDVKKVIQQEKKPLYNKAILDTRLKEDCFNINDTFNCYGTQTERVEMIYCIYEREAQQLFFELTGNRFKILYDNPFGEVDFEAGHGLLSSGYQALIRILLELLYYQDAAVSKNTAKKYWIVIDELDEFLSPKYSAVILEFLKKKFIWANWLVSTHSSDMVAGTLDANLIILQDDTCEVVDINDYEDVTEVQVIFEKLYGKQVKPDNEINDLLRFLLNKKINNAWGKEEDRKLKTLLGKKLSASQQVILKQIQEW